MKRKSLQTIGMTALLLLLATGCARPPQQAPEGAPPAPGQVSSTTGDADLCARAMGNTVVNRTPPDTAAPQIITANGVMLGNVALIAVPSTDTKPTTPSAGPPGATVAPPETPGAVRPPAGAPTSPAPIIPASPPTTAIDRVRAACPLVAEIRTVTGGDDLAKLGQIAMSIREGTPITAYMDEVVSITKRTSVAWTAPARKGS